MNYYMNYGDCRVANYNTYVLMVNGLGGSYDELEWTRITLAICCNMLIFHQKSEKAIIDEWKKLQLLVVLIPGSWVE